MQDWVLRMPWSATAAAKSELLLTREWLVTNGLGGYASGTIAGVASRRYHSLLIAALPSPLGRQVMLNHLSEMLRLPDGTTILFGGEERAGGALELHGADYLLEFRLEKGLPVWRYEVSGFAIEKRIRCRISRTPSTSTIGWLRAPASFASRCGRRSISVPTKRRSASNMRVHTP